MKSLIPRGPALVLGMIVLVACEPTPDIPPLPDLDLVDVLPVVRQQIDTYVRRVEAEPTNANANGHLGMILQAYHQLNDAALMYDRAQALEPNTFAWPYYLGTALAELGDQERAEDAFRSAIDLRPENPHARLALAQLLLDAGDVAESRELFEDTVRRHPERADAHFGYATVLDQEDELDEAIQHYQRALELNGPFGKGYFALTDAYRRVGDAAKSGDMLSHFNKFKDEKLKSDDSLVAAIDRLRTDDRRHIANARRLAQKARYEEAVAELGLALQRNPHSTDIHSLFVQYYSELEEWEKAEVHYRQGLDIDPNWERLHLSFGNMRFAQKRYADAAELFEKALAIDPGYDLARVNLGVALEWHGDADQAADHYRQALANDPTLKRANHRLGRYLAARGEYAEAIKHMERTLEPVDAQTPRTMRMLGQIHMLNGNLDKAISVLEQAKDLADQMNDTQLAAMIQEDLRVLKQARDEKPG